jgi:signal transduction histidine kinase
MGDEQKVKEVITNLVDNAIKYTPEGGKVEVWHDKTEDGLVATHVKDNGLGIDKESREHLFEKFFRVKNEKTQGISGTGLGLFICRQIVEKCGGKIWAESEEGQGSTFSFALKKPKA